jgi:hypothetical protein
MTLLKYRILKKLAIDPFWMTIRSTLFRTDFRHNATRAPAGSRDELSGYSSCRKWNRVIELGSFTAVAIVMHLKMSGKRPILKLYNGYIKYLSHLIVGGERP